MVIILSVAMIFGIMQGLTSIYGKAATYSKVPHTDNLLEYIFDTRY